MEQNMNNLSTDVSMTNDCICLKEKSLEILLPYNVKTVIYFKKRKLFFSDK